MDTVTNYTKLILITAQPPLYLTCSLKQRSHIICIGIGTVGEIIEQVDPLLAQAWQYPLGTQQFFFSLSGINTMFCQDKRLIILPFAKTSQNTTVSGRCRMIDVSLWNLLCQQIQLRKHHGTHCMEIIRKCNIRIFLMTCILHHFQKLIAHQHGQRINLVILKHFK